MRNILQYPITSAETCAALYEAQQAYRQKPEDQIGSTTCLSLFYAEQFIIVHKKEFEEFTKTLPKKINE